MAIKKFNKFWWIGMGLVIGAVLIAFVGVLLGLLGPNEATLAVMVMIVTGVVLAITGVVLWIYGAKDKLKKNSKLPKPSLIIWIVGLSVAAVGAPFMFIRQFLPPTLGTYLEVAGIILASIGVILFIIFLTIWLITRTRKSPTKVVKTKAA
ncbi:MAG: hypothetical protein LBT17_01260 [Mycoplasmataceae bacterium]|nr:hypothetical protein [Mycoplasmataceae bacterium]